MISYTEVENLYQKYKVLDNIKSHMLLVTKIAYILALKLKETNPSIKLNLKNLVYASLLHDIAKPVDFKELKIPQSESTLYKIYNPLFKDYLGFNHAKVASKILKDDYPIISDIIRYHNFFSILELEQDKSNFWEKSILYYADKLSKSDQLVTLEERFEDFQRRYSSKELEDDSEYQDKIRLCQKKAFELEKNIYDKINSKTVFKSKYTFNSLKQDLEQISLSDLLNNIEVIQ